MVIQYDFHETIYIEELYSTEDIIAALGGIAASIKMVTGVLATVVIYQYIIKLAHVI